MLCLVAEKAQHRVGLLTSFKGLEENGTHIRHVAKQGSRQTPPTAQVSAELSNVQQPKSSSNQDQKRAKHQNSAASASTKSPKPALERAHYRLSFGEELEEEEATPSAAFSLAQSTANRFHEERRHWVPGSSALPSGAVETGIASGSQQEGKRLGPIACGCSQTRGPRPYMVCPSPCTSCCFPPARRPIPSQEGQASCRQGMGIRGDAGNHCY